MTEKATEATPAPLTVLTADALAKLSPAEILSYVENLKAAAKAATSIVAEAKSKQSAQARQELEQSLRATLTFPALSVDVLKRINESNAKAASAVYNLETGEAIFTLSFGKAASTVKKDGTLKAHTLGAASMPLTDDYNAHIPEDVRAADTAKIEQLVGNAMTNGAFGGDAAKARNSISWRIKHQSLAKAGVAGY